MEKEREKSRFPLVFDLQNLSKIFFTSKIWPQILETGVSPLVLKMQKSIFWFSAWLTMLRTCYEKNAKKHFLIFRVVNDVTVLLRCVTAELFLFWLQFERLS